MANVDAVAYSGTGQGSSYFYVFKGRRYYRYTHLNRNHDGNPGVLGGNDTNGQPMASIDGATYTGGTKYRANWYIVKGRQYYRYTMLCGNHDGRPGMLHKDVDVCGLECTDGHDGKVLNGETIRWYILGSGRQHRPFYGPAQYLMLQELNDKPIHPACPLTCQS